MGKRNEYRESANSLEFKIKLTGQKNVCVCVSVREIGKQWGQNSLAEGQVRREEVD